MLGRRRRLPQWRLVPLPEPEPEPEPEPAVVSDVVDVCLDVVLPPPDDMSDERWRVSLFVRFFGGVATCDLSPKIEEAFRDNWGLLAPTSFGAFEHHSAVLPTDSSWVPEAACLMVRCRVSTNRKHSVGDVNSMCLASDLSAFVRR